MHWLERMKRLEHKHRKQVVRENVRAYRKRKADAGFRRIEALITSEQHMKLRAMMTPGESTGTAIGRILDSVSGNESMK